MNIFKFIICIFKGHDLGNSIIPFIDNENGLCFCHRCGAYIAYSPIASIMVTKADAMKMQKEFYETFPYALKHEKIINIYGESNGERE